MIGTTTTSASTSSNASAGFDRQQQPRRSASNTMSPSSSSSSLSFRQQQQQHPFFQAMWTIVRGHKVWRIALTSTILCTLLGIWHVSFRVQKKAALRMTPRTPHSSSMSPSLAASVATNTSFLTKFVLTPELEFRPQLCWLISYPNSGTSFTMTTVERASNLSFASNYGEEVTADDEFSLSIYPLRIDGPFWEGTSGKLGAIRELPSTYVLTKTHCGGRCVKCPATEYVVSQEAFVKECTAGHGLFAPRGERHVVHYPTDRVKRAVHLIRHPLDNVVARFHMERKHFVRKDEAWGMEHPNNYTGFQLWCKELDEKYVKEEKVKTLFPDMEKHEAEGLLKLFQKVPCHAEFYKYVKWHARATRMLKELKIPNIIVHYEDYRDDMMGTLQRILDYLEQPLVGTVRTFTANKTYVDDHYTSTQVESIWKLIQALADKETWELIKRYYEV